MEATRKHNSLEISGLGRFDVRPPKVTRKMDVLLKCKQVWEDKLKNTPPDTAQYKNLERKIATLIEDIEALKTKDKPHEEEQDKTDPGRTEE